jgi:transcriptional regulator with XRE-family HTH domain
MTADELRSALDDLGWSQADLARRLSEASGAPVAATTIWRYAAGKTLIQPGVAAYLRLAVEVKGQGVKR